MEFIFTTQSVLIALGIFALRVCDMALDTIRVLFVVRGKKTLAWFLGFFQSLLFVVAISSVLTNLNNPLTILGYAAGFGTGIVIGMLIEARLAVGHVHFTIISTTRGAAIAELLRNSGFGVTEIPARGMEGTVAVLHCDVVRKDMRQLETVVLEADPQAFITAEDVRPVQRGFWRA
ncbi:MAG: DUF5698 domain-containing protein [Anaerolineaceae bacterium]|nr:DUF5698 domain-containing protein [Anaerolineaceae bacterium]